jgi:AcrR family transcriptional regulator
VLTAAAELTREHGFAALTIEGIAERSGVAKTTIYRSWSNKAAIVMDAVFAATDHDLAFPDTGSAVQDLRQQVAAVVSAFNDPSFGPLYVGLLAESQHDEALARALRERLIGPRRAGASEVLRRGVERGELRSDTDIATAIDAIYGAIYYRLLVSHQPLSRQYAHRVVDQAIAGLLPPRSQPASARRPASRSGQATRFSRG